MDSAIDLINQGSLPPSIAGGAAPVTAPPVQQVGQNTKPVGMPAIPAKYAKDPSVQMALKQQQEDDRVRQEQVDILKQKAAADETAGAEETAARKDLIAEGEKGPVKTPMPENIAKHLDPQQLTDQYTAFMTLGAIAGLLTRQPMTAALNNMTAAIDGIQKGDMDQYERNYKEWQTNYKVATEKNKAALEEHQRIMDNKKLSLDEKMAEHKLVDLKYGNQANIAVASKRDYNGYMKALESSRTAQDKAEEKAIEWGKLNEEIRWHDMQQKEKLRKDELMIVGRNELKNVPNKVQQEFQGNERIYDELGDMGDILSDPTLSKRIRTYGLEGKFVPDVAKGILRDNTLEGLDDEKKSKLNKYFMLESRYRAGEFDKGGIQMTKIKQQILDPIYQVGGGYNAENILRRIDESKGEFRQLNDDLALQYPQFNAIETRFTQSRNKNMKMPPGVIKTKTIGGNTYHQKQNGDWELAESAEK